MECLMNIEETKTDQSEFGWDICSVITKEDHTN